MLTPMPGADSKLIQTRQPGAMEGDGWGVVGGVKQFPRRTVGGTGVTCWTRNPVGFPVGSPQFLAQDVACKGTNQWFESGL